MRPIPEGLHVGSKNGKERTGDPGWGLTNGWYLWYLPSYPHVTPPGLMTCIHCGSINPSCICWLAIAFIHRLLSLFL